MFIKTTKVDTESGTCKEQDDVLASEEPLEIRLGYTDENRNRGHRSITIIMRSPGQNSELAVGYLFSENIIDDFRQISSIDENAENLINLELHREHRIDLGRLDDISDKASREALKMSGAEPVTNNKFAIAASALNGLGKLLPQKQDLFHSTCGTHACGVFDNAGNIPLLREDIGRHNAMDKLVGYLLMEKQLPLKNNGLIVSGRASFELLRKALMAGSPMLAALGAPSSLAVNLAQEYNMTLVGFLRDGGFNIYHGEENIII